jgi:hypothetical protein
VRLADYAGAGSRLTIEQAVKLDPRRWSAMVKSDGAYCRIDTDRDGRVASMVHRSGEPVRVQDAGDLYGMATGIPLATLHGEITAHTTAGIAERERLGYPVVHLFDVSQAGGRSVAAQSYSARYDLLMRWQAGAEELGDVPRLDWWNLDERNRAHDPSTGQYTRPVPRDLRRLPVLQLHRGSGAAERLWADHVVRDRGEGIVAVDLTAPLGRRNAKRKVKSTDMIEAFVVAVGARAVTLRPVVGGDVFAVSRGGRELRVGECWEIAADGEYASGAPRFARLVRVRADLVQLRPRAA